MGGSAGRFQLLHKKEKVRKIKVRREDRKCLREVQSDMLDNKDFHDGKLVTVSYLLKSVPESCLSQP